MTTNEIGDETARNSLENPDGPGRVMGIPVRYFAFPLAIVLIAALTDNLESEMMIGFAAVMVIGGVLHWVGDRIPVLREFGLPTVLCILLPAVLLMLGFLPASLAEVVTTFTVDIGFLDFYVGSLIAGSILGMPRQLLLKAGIRYAFPLVGMILSVFLLIGVLGAVLGFGVREAILFVAGPVMGGGVGAGAVPMSEMYAAQLGGSPADYMSTLVPAIVVANTLAIIVAGIYGGITRNGRQLFIGFNGEGNLVRAVGTAQELKVPPRPRLSSFRVLAVGLLVAGSLFLFGQLINSLVPEIHAYAWTILGAAAIKVFGLLPRDMEDAVSAWYGFVAEALTPALLVGISISYLDLSQLGGLLTDPVYLFLTVMAMLFATVLAGALGWLVRMYFVESSVSVGLGMTDMGGTGDVAVVSASNRFELMPFLQISSRLGGAGVLLLLSFLLPIL